LRIWSPTINAYILQNRGKYIINLLSDKYGIDESRVEAKAEVVKAKANPEMDRAVIISFR
jgi:hypothetical protein